MTNNSYPIGKEQCPRCRERGKDNSGDNLAVYSDGHKFCYSCKYTVFPNGIEKLKQKNSEEILQDIEKVLTLPIDCDIVYPQKVLDWIGKYELTKTDLWNNNVLWSDSMQRLIFPVYANGILLAWQGRSFHTQNQAVAKIPKWYGEGNLKDTFHILGKGTSLVLVEDIVSAIKVAKCGVMAMPLFGCVVGRERFKRLYSLYGDIVKVLIWLDFDKAKESIIEAKLGRLFGLNCSNIITKVDPKECSYEEIKKSISL
ncbi:DNA directed DNA polymerase [Caudoviricetes sp.]|nr:DNA directed DNA polymerase [Caudoviricetes sp.]